MTAEGGARSRAPCSLRSSEGYLRYRVRPIYSESVPQTSEGVLGGSV